MLIIITLILNNIFKVVLIVILVIVVMTVMIIDEFHFCNVFGLRTARFLGVETPCVIHCCIQLTVAIMLQTHYA